MNSLYYLFFAQWEVADLNLQVHDVRFCERNICRCLRVCNITFKFYVWICRWHCHKKKCCLFLVRFGFFSIDLLITALRKHGNVSLPTFYFHPSSGLQFPGAAGIVPGVYRFDISNNELCHSTMLLKFILLTGIENCVSFHPFHWGVRFAELTGQLDLFSFFSFFVLELFLEKNWYFWKKNNIANVWKHMRLEITFPFLLQTWLFR